MMPQRRNGGENLLRASKTKPFWKGIGQGRKADQKKTVKQRKLKRQGLFTSRWVADPGPAKKQLVDGFKMEKRGEKRGTRCLGVSGAVC